MKNQEKYNREFKINTVKLSRESSKSMSEIAHDLGVAKST
ncbi:transposase, partial [Candidatus Rhabdochlamydia sp. T3358]